MSDTGYPNPSQISNSHITGSIRKLKEGYGFIAGDDGNNYFFHWSAMEKTGKDFRDLSERERVSFLVAESSKGPRAINVRVLG